MTVPPVFTPDDEEPKRTRAVLITVLIGLVTAFCFEAMDGLMRSAEAAERRAHHAQVQQWRDGIARSIVFRLIQGEEASLDPGLPVHELELEVVESID